MIAILKHKYMVMLTISAITLQSCFVAKDYKQPELIETQNLFRTDELPTDSVSMADVSWKTLFTDAYLNQYIDEGLQNNMDIRIAIQQILSAEAYLKQGKAGYFPTLNGNATVNRSYISGNGQQGAILSSLGTDHIDQFELSGTLSWEADIWGKIRSNKRAYQAGYLQSVAAPQPVKTQLVSSIAATY
ncbi:MAG TPA: TolC family protein, partial [Mariniflexile sp.]|nr:TolC family protein [Mariniflexile sp.]